MPKTAPPREKRKKSTGIISVSMPFVFFIMRFMPDSIAPVRRTMPKAPPTMRMKATTPTADPHLSPETSPSKA